jgi:hypothetical protein
LALISIFFNQILSAFKLIAVIKNQIVMRRESRRIFFICEPIYGSQNAKLSDALIRQMLIA